RVEPRDRTLLGGTERVRRPAISLDLVELPNPLRARERRRGLGPELSRALQQEWLHRPEPGRLRDCERWSETPDARAGLLRLEHRRRADRCHSSVAGAEGDDAARRRQSDARSLA